MDQQGICRPLDNDNVRLYKSSTRKATAASLLSDRRTCVCHRRPQGDRLFVVSARRPACRAPAISRPDARSRRHRQISTGAWRRVAGPAWPGVAGPAGRTRHPIDPRRDAVSRFGRAAGRRVLGRLFVYGEQCSVDGRINLGGIRRTDGRGSALF